MIGIVKRILSVFTVSLVLTSCGGGDARRADCEPTFNGTVGTCLPNGWQEVDVTLLKQRGVPGEVVSAFQAETPASGTYPTVTVTRELLTQEYDPKEYSEAGIAVVRTIAGYQELDQRSVRIDDEKVSIHVFYAQPRTDGPRYRFYQLSTVSKDVGYTFTVAVPLSIPETLEKEILIILENVTFEGE